MEYRATPLLQYIMAGKVDHIINMAKNAIETSGTDTARFDEHGNVGLGDFEVWMSADGTHYVVSDYVH